MSPVGAEEKPDKANGPRAAVRVMDILYELAMTSGRGSLAELSDSLQLPKTSVFSLLRALHRGGYIVQRQGGYELGPEAFKLGVAIAQHRVFPAFLRPTLEELARKTGETIILGVLDQKGLGAEYVDVIESASPLRYSVKVGEIRPLYATTTGKIYLAHFAQARLNDYLARVKREQFTPRTLTDKAALLADLEAIRASGVATNIDGMVEGTTSFGAPIYENNARLAGAVVVSGPQSRMQQKTEAIKALVLEAAAEMSRLLNSSGPYPPVNRPTLELDAAPGSGLG